MPRFATLYPLIFRIFVEKWTFYARLSAKIP